MAARRRQTCSVIAGIGGTDATPSTGWMLGSARGRFADSARLRVGGVATKPAASGGNRERRRSARGAIRRPHFAGARRDATRRDACDSRRRTASPAGLRGSLSVRFAGGPTTASPPSRLRSARSTGPKNGRETFDDRASPRKLRARLAPPAGRTFRHVHLDKIIAARSRAAGHRLVEPEQARAASRPETASESGHSTGPCVDRLPEQIAAKRFRVNLERSGPRKKSSAGGVRVGIFHGSRGKPGKERGRGLWPDSLRLSRPDFCGRRRMGLSPMRLQHRELRRPDPCRRRRLCLVRPA